MTEYSEAFKANMVKKMMLSGGPTASALSIRSGICQPTLSRWLRDPDGMESGDVSLMHAPGHENFEPWFVKNAGTERARVGAIGFGAATAGGAVVLAASSLPEGFVATATGALARGVARVGTALAGAIGAVAAKIAGSPQVQNEVEDFAEKLESAAPSIESEQPEITSTEILPKEFLRAWNDLNEQSGEQTVSSRLSAFFKANRNGGDFKPPEGVTKDMLDLYRRIAVDSIESGRSEGANADFQKSRIELIERALEKLGSK